MASAPPTDLLRLAGPSALTREGAERLEIRAVMDAKTVDHYLGQLGALDSEGEFSVNPLRARDRLMRFQLEAPHLYILQLVAAAVMSGATLLACICRPWRFGASRNTTVQKAPDQPCEILEPWPPEKP